MAASNSERKSVKDSLSTGNKNPSNSLQSNEFSAINENASNNDRANVIETSVKNNSSNISEEDTNENNILKDTAAEKHFRLTLELKCRSDEKSDFQNGEGKAQSIHYGHFFSNDDKSQFCDDDGSGNHSNVDFHNKDNEDSNCDDEIVCQVIDEDGESVKNTGSSVSNKEDSDDSVYEEVSQHSGCEESNDTVVPSEEDKDDSTSIIVKKSSIKVGDTVEGNSHIYDSAQEDKSSINTEESNSEDSVYVMVQSDDDATEDPFVIIHSINKRDSPDSSDSLHELPAKRQKLLDDHDFIPSINNTYIGDNFIKELSTAFQAKKANVFEHCAEIIIEPFTCCVLPNFIEPEEYLYCLKQELMNIKMTEKLNDLYQFKSTDLEDSREHNISAFKRLINEECLKWMTKITNIPLNAKVDISCASYTKTDYLLCHDDELEGRRIAFIFYLVPPDWDAKDGGSLDLFASVDGQPHEIHRSILPKFNNFVFFEVGPVSFHQVSEILTSKNRLSVSGWFHGPPLVPSIPKKEKLMFSEPIEKIDITEWINPVYFETNTQLNIRAIFEETCEISLPDFLKETKYKEVSEALMDCNISWTRRGPYNMRNFHEAAGSDKIPQIIQDCKNVFSSEAFFLTLSNLTALNLYSIDKTKKLGKVYSCIRKWNHGSYTLLHDQSFAEEYSLNVVLHFNCFDWTSEYGGSTSYVAIDDKEELLQIDPKPNSLGVVYITEGTSNFVKYVNSQVNKISSPFFHDIYSMYIENDGNENLP